MQQIKLELTEITQYLNDFSSSVREVGDKTSNSLYEVRGEIASLTQTLTITNYLLLGLLILNTALLLFIIFKNRKS